MTMGMSRSQALVALCATVGLAAGGCSQHGQGRAITQGYIAGKEAANEQSST